MSYFYEDKKPGKGQANSSKEKRVDDGLGLCFDFTEGTCARGNSCRFKHSRSSSGSSSSSSSSSSSNRNQQKQAEKETCFDSSRDVPTGVVLLGDSAPSKSVKELALAKKKKKPKHLKRKAEQAEQITDLEDKMRALEEVARLREETEAMNKQKQTNAIKWKNICRKQTTDAGKEWDEDRFNNLVASGVDKEAFLAQLVAESSSDRKNSKIKHNDKSKSEGESKRRCYR